MNKNNTNNWGKRRTTGPNFGRALGAATYSRNKRSSSRSSSVVG